MKTILSKFIEAEFELERIDFGKILSEKKMLCVIFPDNLEIAFQLYSFFATWKDIFQRFQFCFSDNLLAFFSHLSFSKNIQFVTYHNFIPCENAVLFNFLMDCFFLEDIASSQQTIIVDMKQVFNVKFSPVPKTELQLLERFANHFAFPLKKEQISIKPIHDVSQLFDNNGIHIVLDINEAKFAKYYESIIKMVKNECNANFYLTGIPFEQDDFIHVANIKMDDIFELFKLASNADLFISDDYSLLIILKKYIKNTLFFGKEGTFSDVPCLHPKNIFELKNLILEKR